ncbi:hypothetical protein HYU50_01680 [Candidatus Woesearchaeota archaeon]|nr:hypothetical protein [Candidatus Woesearchaeota archaeon]
MTNEIEKEYSKLANKYKLPDFKGLDLEFEINELESTSFVLRNILRKVAEKIEFYTDLINDLLQPDTASLSGMHETRFFMDEEKSSIYDLFKKLMKSYRNIIMLILEQDEKKQAEFLNSFYREWAEIKKQLLAYLEKMKDSWDRETSIEQDLGYFG